MGGSSLAAHLRANVSQVFVKQEEEKNNRSGSTFSQTSFIKHADLRTPIKDAKEYPNLSHVVMELERRGKDSYVPQRRNNKPDIFTEEAGLFLGENLFQQE